MTTLKPLKHNVMVLWTQFLHNPPPKNEKQLELCTILYNSFVTLL
jgi:hypothetical protein